MDHNDGMGRGHFADPEYFADQMRELPNKWIIAGIRYNCEKSSFNYNKMIKELIDKDMDRCERSSQDPIDVEVFAGYIPNRTFGLPQVLQIVRDYAPRAELVPVPARG